MMEMIIIGNFLLCILVGSICVFFGLDLKKWTSWLLGLYAFLSGSLIGLLRSGEPLSFEVGAIFAFAVMYTGAMTYRHRQRYTKEDIKPAIEKFNKLRAAKKNRKKSDENK